MKHRSLIFGIVAVLALGLVGYGYAAWSSSVAINATVNTGTLQLGIATAGTTDGTDVLDNVWSGTEAVAADPAYDVGSLIGANGTLVEGSTTYYEDVTETYENVYPLYAAGYTTTIANLGTIPITLLAPEIVWTGDPSVQANYTVYSWELTDASSAVLAEGTSNDMSSIASVELPAEAVATLTVNAYFADTDLAQGATGTQTITITGNQFNVSTP